MASKKNNNIRLRGIALPNEHGSWGFLFEPLVAAVAIAPTIQSFSVSILVIGVFLTRQPFKIRFSNWLESRDLPVNRFADKFIAAYGALVAAGLVACVFLLPVESLWPFALVIPLGIYQVYCDVFRKSRQLLPEITGAVAISSSAAVITFAAGWTTAEAIALWGVLIARFATSILYVRNRLLLEKGKKYKIVPTISLHLFALAGVSFLAFNGFSSWLVAAAFVLLLIRASAGLSIYRKKTKAMVIGVWEVVYGLITVSAIIAGHYVQ